MSLQAVINPLEFLKSGPAMIGKKVEQTPEQHMQNTGGFDPSSLMAAPQLRQDATMNQANMVSSPYFEANEKAAEKTNPMNAASQEPGKLFLMKFIGK